MKGFSKTSTIKYGTQLKRLIDWMLSQSPAQRPTVQMLLADEYVK